MIDATAAVETAESHPHAFPLDVARYRQLLRSPLISVKKSKKPNGTLDIVYFGPGLDTSPTTAFSDEHIWYVDPDEATTSQLSAAGLPQNNTVIEQSGYDFSLPKNAKPDIVILRNASFTVENPNGIRPLVEQVDTDGLVICSAWGTHSDAAHLVQMPDFELAGFFREGDETTEFIQQDIEQIRADLIADAKRADGFDLYAGTTFVFRKKAHEEQSPSLDPETAKILTAMKNLEALNKETMSPSEKYAAMAKELEAIGPLAIKMIQTIIPFIRLKQNKTPDEEAFLSAFGSVRTNYGTSDETKTAATIARSEAVATGHLAIDTTSPIGRASVYEVYKANTPDHPQRKLAAKVQQPDARNKFKTSLNIAHVIVEQAPLDDHQKQVADVAFSLAEDGYEAEFDTKREIAALQKLARIGIKTPRVYPELSSDEIIVMDELEKSIPISNYSQTSPIEKRRKVAGRYIASLIRMVRNGVLAGDPHGGNVLVDPKDQIYHIDPSPLIETSTAQLHRLYSLLRNVRKNDKPAILRDLNQFSEHPLDGPALAGLTTKTGNLEGIAFYAEVFRAGLIPHKNSILLARALAEAVGTVYELIPEKQSKLRWGQILAGALFQSFV